MKLNEGKIFVFVAAIIIGVLISFNIHLNTATEREYISTKEYQEAYNRRNKLYREISDLKEDYYDNYKKLNSYKDESQNKNDKVIETIMDELESNKTILGYKQVQGEGIEVTITDGFNELNPDIEDPLLRYMRTFHNTDLIQLINELKSSGAEAISINGQRLMNNSEVYCSSAFISINGVKLPAPFYIDVIGSMDKFRTYFGSNDTYIKRLQGRGINVSFEEKEEINIPGYIGELKVNYLINAKNK
ncbi:DUF881 domain-containing protein [Clostridium sp. MSJ-4]|uniref:DUF881 domain-containing protein n=1 Tax=Clostridium simiarum TaxID=2841506 RepID=A0ABS6EX37_9CLOT|nr:MULTISPECIES: DUF881 domain-containing protein [Clostridium]MBU5590790.1 DUF881 domain-containing protein [Clostridium simiarum]